MVTMNESTLVCVSGFNDGAQMLRECVQSANALGFHVLYMDGAYPLFLDDPDEDVWTSDEALQKALVDLHVDEGDHEFRWTSEADKKNEVLRQAETLRTPSGGWYKWALFLDVDERLEGTYYNFTPEDHYKLGDPTELWWINMYRYDVHLPHNPQGFPMPRMLRLHPSLHFKPPRDYDVYREEKQIAFMDGATIPSYCEGHYALLDPGILRIRHERNKRTDERRNKAGRYYQRQRGDVNVR